MFVVTTSKAGNVKKIDNAVGICTKEELEVRFGEDFIAWSMSILLARSSKY
jgi:hypothetical protein